MTWPWRERKAREWDASAASVDRLLKDAQERKAFYEREAQRFGRLADDMFDTYDDMTLKAELLRLTPWWKPVRGVR